MRLLFFLHHSLPLVCALLQAGCPVRRALCTRWLAGKPPPWHPDDNKPLRGKRRRGRSYCRDSTLARTTLLAWRPTALCADVGRQGIDGVRPLPACPPQWQRLQSSRGPTTILWTPFPWTPGQLQLGVPRPTQPATKVTMSTLTATLTGTRRRHAQPPPCGRPAVTVAAAVPAVMTTESKG